MVVPAITLTLASRNVTDSATQTMPLVLHLIMDQLRHRRKKRCLCPYPNQSHHLFVSPSTPPIPPQVQFPLLDPHNNAVLHNLRNVPDFPHISRMMRISEKVSRRLLKPSLMSIPQTKKGQCSVSLRPERRFHTNSGSWLVPLLKIFNNVF